MSSADAAEAQFYEALREGDLDALLAVWSDDDEVYCVHPGGERLCGPAAVRAAFETMLSQGGLPVQAQQVRRLVGVGQAVHSVLERIALPGDKGPAWVVATNVYVQTPQGWRMVAHHASPARLDAPPEAPAAPGVLH
jgi:ketosteroid isomerase-like protein